MTLDMNAGAAQYAVFWGTQLAMTSALAGTMSALWLRLHQPIMRALSLHWLARLLVPPISLAYYLADDPAHPAFIPLAALAGLTCGILYLTARDAVDRAAPVTVRTRPVRWTPVLLVFSAIAFGAHLANVLTGFSPGIAALWTRALFGFVYLSFLVRVALRWLDHPAARHRLLPMLIGVLLMLVCEGFDAAQRARVLSGALPIGGHVLTIVVSLAGTLSLGVGTFLTALESERDTVRRQAERLALAQQEQAEAQRLQSLGRLASGVAHDFNNVLGLIINGIEFVDQSLLPTQSEARRDLGDMRAAADRGAALTRRLRGLARPRSASDVRQRSRITPAAVLRENLPMLQRLLSTRISLQAQVHGTAAIPMDRADFEQVVINLLVNARDATPGTGIVRLLLDEEYVEHETKASLGRVSAGEWIRLSVVDDGVGIEPDILPNVFEPFFTTKGDHGTGLGLATIAAAIREVHGAVDVYSSPGRGTRVDLWLPVAPVSSEIPIVSA